MKMSKQMGVPFYILVLSLTIALSHATPTLTNPHHDHDGAYDSPCNTTLDCQSSMNLHCERGACLCSEPEVFDIREHRCLIPLGKECDPGLSIEENNCPEFAECFMEHCVCKTGYSMHTMTRCKSDYHHHHFGSMEDHHGAESKVGATIWPQQSVTQEEDTSLESCTPDSCDESKGLRCHGGGSCKCKDPKEVYLDELSRCISPPMQKSLKDALSMMSDSEDDIKSFVKLLEKFQDGAPESDQDVGASNHYNRPLHQLIDIFGGGHNGDNKHAAPFSKYSHLYDHGDLHTAAQEPAAATDAEGSLPSGTQLEEGAAGSGVAVTKDGDTAGSNAPAPSTPSEQAPHAESTPPRQDPIPVRDRPPLTYGLDSSESVNEGQGPHHYHLPLDNLQPQSQEPAIVERQAPSYSQHGEGIPLDGYGIIPEGSHHFGRFPYFPFDHGGHHGGHHLGHGGHHLGHRGGGHVGHLHGGPGHHHHPPPKKAPGLLVEMAELLGKSFKLVDKFLPIVHLISEALKKDEKKIEGHRGHRDISKEEIGKEGALLGGFTKFLGLLLRLRKRLDIIGGPDALKKLLT